MTVPCSYPQKVGKGLFSYITYRVYTCIGLDRMAKNEYTVYRRYRDFLQLHEKLEDRCGLVLVHHHGAAVVACACYVDTLTPASSSPLHPPKIGLNQSQ